jgi:sulfonate transport system substrate-binding protein
MPKTTRRSLLASGLLATAGLAGSLAQPARAQAPASIRIGVATGGVGSPPRTGGHAVGIVNAQGLLEKEFANDGIRIDWIFFKGAGPAVNEALVNQQLDLVWQGDLPSIVHRASGVKTSILLGAGVRTGLYLGVPPGSGIARLEDLRGRRVAVFKGTNLHLAAVRALAAHGLKESDVKLINLDTAASQAALTTQDIDAVFGYVNLFGLRDKGVAKVVWSAAQDSYRFTRQTVLLGTDDFIRKHPALVQRVVDVVVRTARAYSDEARRGDLFAEWGKAELPAQVWREDFIGQPLRVRLSPLLDPFLVARYKDAADESFKLRLTRRKPEIDSWFDRRFLDVALKAQKLEGYWPAYAANGELSGSQAGQLASAR